MQSKVWISSPKKLTYLLILFLCGVASCGSAWGQDDENGNADLDKAFDAKLNAASTKDLDSVVKLCESALEKGLDKESEKQAKTLAGSALFEHAEQLGQRIFATNGQDTRWRIYRSQALLRLRKVVEFQPEMAEAYLMIAKLNGLPNGDQDEAMEAIEKAIELAGDENEQLSDALFLRAKLTDDEETVIADLNQAIKINPENIDAVRRRASYYLGKQNPAKALPDLKKWLDSDSQNVMNHIVAAESLLAMGEKFDEKIQGEAIDIVDTAIELEPDNADTHYLRARLNLIAEKPDEAIADASRAIKLDRKNIRALMIRATVLSDRAAKEGRTEEERNKDLAAALEDIEEVLELSPYQAAAIYRRGVIYSQQQNLPKAIEDFKLLADSDRSESGYQLQLAMLYGADDQPSQAIRIYKNLLRQSRVSETEGKKPEEQIQILSQRLAALRGAANARLSTGDHKKAIEHYDEALAISDQIFDIEEAEGMEDLISPDEGVLNNLAWVLSTSPKDELRDGKRAITLATQAAELTDFDQAYILSTLASAYAETGDFDNAIKWIQKAIKVNKQKGEDGTVDKERTEEQSESLQKEYEKYKAKEPWRELQDVEAENAAMKKAEAEAEKKEADNDDDDSKDEDEAQGEDEKDEDEKDEDEKDEDEKDEDGDDPEVDQDEEDKDKDEEVSTADGFDQPLYSQAS